MCCDCCFEVMRGMLSGRLSGRGALKWYEGRYSPWCRHHHRADKWITVYLSDYSEGEKGCYDLVLDFYTLFDYFRYLEFQGESGEDSYSFNVETPRLSTFFYVADYRGEEKPHRGHYYMNLEVLAERWQRGTVAPPEGNRPAYYIASYSGNQENKNTDGQLLIAAEPMVYPQRMFLDYLNKAALPALKTTDYKLKVNNVEQGNWNEILADNEPYLMFDIGTNAFGDNIENDIQRQLRNHPLQKDVTALFISHWHADHYNILTGMNNAERNHIKQLVCTSSIYNLTAFNIILWYNLNPQTTLCMLNHPSRVKWQRKELIDGILYMYVRRFVKSNPNNGGLLLYFNGAKNSVTLTGDANYSTIQEVTNDGITKANSQGGYYLVVPHHGGSAGKYTCNIDARVQKHEAIVSVGEINPYNHPDDDILRSLQNSFRHVTCTSYNQYEDTREL